MGCTYIYNDQALQSGTTMYLLTDDYSRPIHSLKNETNFKEIRVRPVTFNGIVGGTSASQSFHNDQSITSQRVYILK